LFFDGHIELHKLDTSADVYMRQDELAKVAEAPSLGDFLEGLTGLGDSAVDFALSLRQYMDSRGVSDGARKVIEKAVNR
jgi:hypothetical protein